MPTRTNPGMIRLHHVLSTTGATTLTELADISRVPTQALTALWTAMTWFKDNAASGQGMSEINAVDVLLRTHSLGAIYFDNRYQALHLTPLGKDLGADLVQIMIDQRPWLQVLNDAETVTRNWPYGDGDLIGG